MKAYGFSQIDMSSCRSGCCTRNKNTANRGKRCNVKALEHRAKSAARRQGKKETSDARHC